MCAPATRQLPQRSRADTQVGPYIQPVTCTTFVGAVRQPLAAMPPYGCPCRAFQPTLNPAIIATWRAAEGGGPYMYPTNLPVFS